MLAGHCARPTAALNVAATPSADLPNEASSATVAWSLDEVWIEVRID